MLTEKVWCKTLKPNYTYPLKTISNYRLNRNFTIFLFHNIVTIMIIMTQVCLEEMAPPKRIFQCKNGHHLCETCKWAKMSFLKYKKVLLQAFHHQDRVEHLPQMQTADDWEGHWHGGIPEVLWESTDDHCQGQHPCWRMSRKSTYILFSARSLQ